MGADTEAQADAFDFAGFATLGLGAGVLAGEILVFAVVEDLGYGGAAEGRHEGEVELALLSYL